VITKEALQYINAQAMAIGANQALDNTTLVPGEIPRLAVCEGVSLESTERFLPAPVRFRGEFATTSLAAFVGYVLSVIRAREGSPIVFIDPEEMKAISFFDLGTAVEPGWGGHYATLRVPQTAEFRALIENSLVRGKHFTQLDFVDFMGDWAPNLKFFDESDYGIPAAAVIRAVKNVKIEEMTKTDNAVGHYAAERTTLEGVEVSAKNGDRLPAQMTFTCIPFEEFESRAFVCSMRSVVKSDKTARLAYHVTALEAERLKIAEEFKRRISDMFGDSPVELHVGTFKKGAP
jgi:uncharacterized protein YfdQ (DUF2303 family)